MEHDNFMMIYLENGVLKKIMTTDPQLRIFVVEDLGDLMEVGRGVFLNKTFQYEIVTKQIFDEEVSNIIE